MIRNKIYSIVEGHGEANLPRGKGKSAVTVLIGRLLHYIGCYTLFPNESSSAFRMSYSEFFYSDKFERAIRYHKQFDDCAAVLTLLDMDDACPIEKATELSNRISRMESLPFSVVVVCAKCEYESWFLASLEAIHPGYTYENDPEQIRGAKEWLRKNFGYKPTHHQLTYTQKIDIELARQRSRSFRRLHHAFEEIDLATTNEISIITPLVIS